MCGARFGAYCGALAVLLLCGPVRGQEASPVGTATRPAVAAPATRPSPTVATTRPGSTVASAPAWNPVEEEVTEQSLQRMIAALPRLQAHLKAKFEAGKEWRSAVEAAQRAQKEHAAARRAVLDQVRARPEHQKARTEQDSARAEYDALMARSDTSEAMDRASRRLLAANAAVSRLEGDALQASSEVVGTRKMLLDARATLAALKAQFEQTYQSDPEWVDYLQRILAAQKQLLDERRAQEARDRAQAQVDRENHRRSRLEYLIALEERRLALEYLNSLVPPIVWYVPPWGYWPPPTTQPFIDPPGPPRPPERAPPEDAPLGRPPPQPRPRLPTKPLAPAPS